MCIYHQKQNPSENRMMNWSLHGYQHLADTSVSQETLAFLFVCFGERISFFVAGDHFEFLVLLPLPLKCLDYLCGLAYLVLCSAGPGSCGCQDGSEPDQLYLQYLVLCLLNFLTYTKSVKRGKRLSGKCFSDVSALPNFQ